MSLVVADAGAVLVASAPGGPVPSMGQSPDRRQQDDGEEVADVVAGKRDLVVQRVGACPFGGGGDGEDGAGGQGEGCPAVPGGPAADLCWSSPVSSLPVWKSPSTAHRLPATR